jgi:murein DD-endopeptidase MepM/ murein hydrolase activator NlpD
MEEITRRRRISPTGILYLLLVHLLAGLFIYEKVTGKEVFAFRAAQLSDTLHHHVSENSAILLPTDTPQQQKQAAPDYTRVAGPRDALLIPVAGIKRKDLQDTYTQSRSGGRVHNAIDIMAPEGTPVVAVADGTIAKLYESQMGGITVYQWSADKKFVYYYAHLQRRVDGLQEKAPVKRGQVIGYVGDSGNAGKGNFHLHFTITIPKDSTRHWDGEDVNPYPILMNGIEVP